MRDLWPARVLAGFALWFAVVFLDRMAAGLGYAAGLGREGALGFGAAVGVAVTVLVLAILCRRWDRRPLRALAAGSPEAFQRIVPGFGLGLLAMAVAVGAALLGGGLGLDAPNPHHLALPAAALLLGGGLLGTLGLAVDGELIFRGYLLQNLGDRFPLWQATALTSVLFALAHLPGAEPHPVALLELLAAGVLLGVLRLATGSIWMGVGFQCGWDFLRRDALGTSLFPERGAAAGNLEGTFVAVLVALVLALIGVAVMARAPRRADWSGRMAEDGALPRVGMFPRVVIRAPR